MVWLGCIALIAYLGIAYIAARDTLHMLLVLAAPLSTVDYVVATFLALFWPFTWPILRVLFALKTPQGGALQLWERFYRMKDGGGKMR